MTRLSKLKASEGDIKKAVEDYLKIKEKQGVLMYLRLNAGDFLVSNKDGTKRRIKGCPKGTADFEVIMGSKWNKLKLPKVYFLELKSEEGKQSKEQREFQKKVRAQGAHYYLIRSVEEVMLLLYPDEPI